MVQSALYSFQKKKQTSAGPPAAISHAYIRSDLRGKSFGRNFYFIYPKQKFHNLISNEMLRRNILQTFKTNAK